jgi:hypothetical protein
MAEAISLVCSLVGTFGGLIWILSLWPSIGDRLSAGLGLSKRTARWGTFFGSLAIILVGGAVAPQPEGRPESATTLGTAHSPAVGPPSGGVTETPLPAVPLDQEITEGWLASARKRCDDYENKAMLVVTSLDGAWLSELDADDKKEYWNLFRLTAQGPMWAACANVYEAINMQNGQMRMSVAAANQFDMDYNEFYVHLGEFINFLHMHGSTGPDFSKLYTPDQMKAFE